MKDERQLKYNRLLLVAVHLVGSETAIAKKLGISQHTIANRREGITTLKRENFYALERLIQKEK